MCELAEDNALTCVVVINPFTLEVASAIEVAIEAPEAKSELTDPVASPVRAKVLAELSLVAVVALAALPVVF